MKISSRIKKHYGDGGFLGAIAILQQVMRARDSGFPAGYVDYVSFLAFSKGKEQGFTIVAGDSFITVTQYYGEWVVYHGADKKIFSFDQQARVVKHILSLMKKGLKRVCNE